MQGRGGVPGPVAARLLRGRADADVGAGGPAARATADAGLLGLDARLRVRALRGSARRPAGVRPPGRLRDPARPSYRRGQVRGQLPPVLRRRAQEQDQDGIHVGAHQDVGRHHERLPLPERPRSRPESRLHLRGVQGPSGGGDGAAQAHTRQGDAVGSRGRGGLGRSGAGRSGRRGSHGNGKSIAPFLSRFSFFFFFFLLPFRNFREKINRDQFPPPPIVRSSTVLR